MPTNPNSFGAFAEGLVGGIGATQDIRRRYEENEALRDERRTRETRRALQDEITGLPSDYFTDSSQYVPERELQGPPAPGQQGPLKTTNPGQHMQNLMLRAQLAGDEDTLAALQRTAAIGATQLVNQARQARDPRQEVELLNRASEIVGAEGGFSLNDNGAIVDPFGQTVTPEMRPAMYQYLAQLARDPVAAFQQYGQAAAGLRGEKRDQEQLDLSKRIADERASQAWTEIAQRWKALGITDRELIEKKRQFDAEYNLKLKQFGLDKQLTDAQSAYYLARAAESEAEAKVMGIPSVWGKQSDLLSALETMDEQFAESLDAQFSDDYAKQFGAPSGEELRGAASSMAKEAVAEHGPQAMADAMLGAKYAMAAMLGDPNVQIEDLVDDTETGKSFIVVEGRNYPVSQDTASQLEAKQAAAFDRSERGALDIFKEPTKSDPLFSMPGQPLSAKGREIGEGWRQLKGFIQHLRDKRDRFWKNVHEGASKPREAIPSQ